MGPPAGDSPHVIVVCIEGDGLKFAKAGIELSMRVRGAASSEVRKEFYFLI